jgi:phosphoesterase RecJ-like protein
VETQLDEGARALFVGAKRRVKIDHHPNSRPAGDVNIFKPLSSTCEIIAGIAGENGWTITKEIAKLLYSGIYTDTGGFVHEYTTSATMRVAAILIEAGAQPSWIARRLSEKPMGTFLNNAETLARAQFAGGGKIGFTTFSVRKKDAGDRPHRETGWLHANIMCVKETEVSAIFKELDAADPKVHVSLRSKSKHVNSFAERFGGGGHALAAAFSMDGTLSDVVARVIPDLAAVFNAGK